MLGLREPPSRSMTAQLAQGPPRKEQGDKDNPRSGNNSRAYPRNEAWKVQRTWEKGGTHQSQVPGTVQYRSANGRLRGLRPIYGQRGRYGLGSRIRRRGGHFDAGRGRLGVGCVGCGWIVLANGAWPGFLKGSRRPAGLARGWRGGRQLSEKGEVSSV